MAKKTPTNKAAAKKATKPAEKTAGKKDKRLEKVPVEYVFWCCDGNIYTDIYELAAGLANMTDETFAYHQNVEKHDFCNWVRDVVEDAVLADELISIVNRLEAAERVAARIRLLT